MILTHKALHAFGLLLVLFVAAYANIKFYEKTSRSASKYKQGQIWEYYNLVRVVIAVLGILVVLDYFFGPFGHK